MSVPEPHPTSTSRQGAPGAGTLGLFGIAIFTAAALLFMVQPLAGKILLPLLGGSPAVWNACMLFFQAALLLGYLYAHLLSQMRSVRAQAIVHLVLFAGAAFTLPFPIDLGVPGSNPTLWVVRTLGLTVGPAFVLVSTSGPLLQRWFSRSGHAQAQDPYFLYAASNAGSLLGLLAYPIVIEPTLTRQGQSAGWRWAYFALIVLVASCAARVVRGTSGAIAGAPTPGSRVTPSGFGWASRLRWVLLAAVPSSLMLGVTQHITTDLASIPLFWIVPLTIYLLTFVSAYSRRLRIEPAWTGYALPVLIAALAVITFAPPAGSVLVPLGLHLLTFGVAGLMCHTLLADARPPTDRLTEYYLMISLGGVLGGSINALLGPVVFDTIIEYPIMLSVAALLRPQFVRRRPGGGGLVGAGVLALVGLAGAGAMLASHYVDRANVLRFRERTFFGVHRVKSDADGNYCILEHGTTAHGLQYHDAPGPLAAGGGPTLDARQRRALLYGAAFDSSPPGRAPAQPTLDDYRARQHARAIIPTMYFHTSGPLGDAFRLLTQQNRLTRAGFIGLGAGTIAAYAQPGVSYDIYEIDPVVVDVAREDSRFFTYIHDAAHMKLLPGQAAPHFEYFVGDGRLQLAKAHGATPEDPPYELIVLDAFSSDSIPVHLITREAVELYFRKLTPSGLLVVHLSNRNFDLPPVLGRIAAELKLSAFARYDSNVTREQAGESKFPSIWAVLARDGAYVGWLPTEGGWEPLRPGPGVPLWTDDYSNLLGAMRSMAPTRGAR